MATEIEIDDSLYRLAFYIFTNLVMLQL